MGPCHKPLLWVLVGCSAVPASAFPADQQPDQHLEEFVVTGRQLDFLRKELIDAEDQFFDRYNTLVGRQEYQIHCRKEQPLGSRIPRRYCRTGFEDNALAQAGREAAAMLQSFYNELRLRSSWQVSTPMPDVTITTTSVTPGEILGKRGDFRQRVRDVVAKDPELLRLLVRHAELLNQYNKVQNELFGPTRSK